MTKPQIRVVGVGAILSALIGILMFFVSAGEGLGAGVSNCNRDCNDGSTAYYVAIACGGLAMVLLVVWLFAPRPKPPGVPTVPEARIHRD